MPLLEEFYPEAWDYKNPVTSAGWDGNTCESLQGNESLQGTNWLYALADMAMMTAEGQRAFAALEAECERAGVDVGRMFAAAIGCVPSRPPPKDEGFMTNPEGRMDAVLRMRRALARALQRRRYVSRSEESLRTIEEFRTSLWVALELLQDHVIGP